MRTFETGDWVLLNNIIYNIYTTENFDEMRQGLLEQLKLLFDYDSAAFYMASKEDGQLLCAPVTYNCDDHLMESYEELYENKEILHNGKMLIYRETDMMPEEIRTTSDTYLKLYKPNNWHYGLQMILAKQNRFLGVVSFYRSIGKEDFLSEDIFVLDMLKEHLAYKIEKQLDQVENDTKKLTISECIAKYELSKREATVLKELMAGRENGDICEKLFITSNTLKKHILNIYRKLGIRNRVQLFKLVKEKE